MTRRVALAGGAVLVALVLAAAPLAGPAVTPTSTPAPGVTARNVDAEAAYTAQVRRWSRQIGNRPYDELVAIGQGMCGGLQMRPEPTVTPVPVSGISAYDTRVVIRAATQHLCPDQAPKVRNYLTGGGRR
ncbi:DUF732 domain-containing protein [Thermomonospora cellulosilytica]|uniref:DUF732 domain-containing protein n=1 Tax=Thermomonospora cellulosilytica TaxID=1411118 RepID=A0A7W3N203_9ACTN|nr:DUF732 domain-containing protein [Thermomonospora cellulosilytica]MBA9006007.1 hypothetical protein [Thermomonospora cellulosilytica]